MTDAQFYEAIWVPIVIAVYATVSITSGLCMADYYSRPNTYKNREGANSHIIAAVFLWPVVLPATFLYWLWHKLANSQSGDVLNYAGVVCALLGTVINSVTLLLILWRY